MANSILSDQLPDSTLGLGGATPAIRPGAKETSTIHFKSGMVNGKPVFEVAPSKHDLDGKTPPKYINPETGATY